MERTRSHKKIEECLNIHTQDNKWDEELPKAMLTYITTNNRNLNYTPYELQFGRKAYNVWDTKD